MLHTAPDQLSQLYRVTLHDQHIFICNLCLDKLSQDFSCNLRLASQHLHTLEMNANAGNVNCEPRAESLRLNLSLWYGGSEWVTACVTNTKDFRNVFVWTPSTYIHRRCFHKPHVPVFYYQFKTKIFMT